MVRKREAGSRLGRLRLNWLERVVVWIRKRLGLNKQRPSPLKEMKIWRT